MLPDPSDALYRLLQPITDPGPPILACSAHDNPCSMANNQKPFVQPGEPLHEFLRSFWQRQIDAAEQETIDYRHPPLPLARIKKVMKSDPDVKVAYTHRYLLAHGVVLGHGVETYVT